MRLTDQLEKLVSEKSRQVSMDADLRALSDFYEAAKRDGIVKAPVYDLPQIDTIGRPVRRSD
jgi:hypothetical protein